MNSLTCLAHAKINLTLDVGPRRADGYHEIRSVMQTVALHDTLTVTRSPKQGVQLEVAGDQAAGVPTDSANLVHQAASRLLTRLTGPSDGLHLLLHKRIPSQAGLGGGSSDAAATLRAVNALLGLHLPRQTLAEIGATLGADVAFFLSGGTALARGRGENVTSLLPLTPPWPLVIVKPPVGVSTAAAYAALDAEAGRVPGTATDDWLAGTRRLSNDFEATVQRDYPAIAQIYQSFHQTEVSGESFKPLLCGSGAAVFCRMPTREAAQGTARRIRAEKLGDVWETTTQEAEA